MTVITTSAAPTIEPIMTPTSTPILWRRVGVPGHESPQFSTPLSALLLYGFGADTVAFAHGEAPIAALDRGLPTVFEKMFTVVPRVYVQVLAGLAPPCGPLPTTSITA